MAQCCGADEDVQVADKSSCRSQVASLTGEYATCHVVEVDDCHAIKKLSQNTLIILRVISAKYAFIDFGKRYDTYSQAIREKFHEATCNWLSTAHVFDCPVGINQILHHPQVLGQSMPLLRAS